MLKNAYLQSVVAHVCNPSTQNSGDSGRRNLNLRSAWATEKDPALKTKSNQANKHIPYNNHLLYISGKPL
jgi:hypothetical protein